MSVISDNLRRVKDKMAQAALACGRKPEAIELLAISKHFPVDDIAQAIDEGQLRFGESRVQEAEAKVRSLKGTPGIEWHLVGHLQTNKARLAAELFDLIHSVDSVKLASRLNDSSLALGKCLPVLLQVDLGMEDTKFGVNAEEVQELVAAMSRFEGVRLDGLMTIPPFFENTERARPYFVELRRLSETLESGAPGCLGRRRLSMGMSHDFEVAIQEGATTIRVGTAIFGERSLG